MENEQNLELGGGIKALSIIQIVFDSIAILMYVLMIAFFDKVVDFLKNSGKAVPASVNVTTYIITAVFAAIIIVSLIMILKRMAAGVYMYFACVLVNIIVSIILNGFSVLSIVLALIFPVIMAILIKDKKEVFGIGKKNNTEAQ